MRPKKMPQSILIFFLVIFPLISFIAVLTAALMCQVLKHLVLFPFTSLCNQHCPVWGSLKKKCHYVLGFENEMAQTSVVQIAAMYCHGHFSPKVAKPLHSSNKNTRRKKLICRYEPDSFQLASPSLHVGLLFLFFVRGRKAPCQWRGRVTVGPFLLIQDDVALKLLSSTLFFGFFAVLLSRFISN